MNRTGFRRDPDDRFQAAVATCWSAQYAASYSAGGTSSQAEWSLSVFHQWTQAAVSIDLLDAPPGTLTVDQLGLVEPVHGLGEGIVI